MQLQTLLKDFADIQFDCPISGIVSDTRKLMPGQTFIALEGPHGHSLQFANQAIAKGASAIIYDPGTISSIELLPKNNCPVIAIENLDVHLGTIAARYYTHPSSRLDVIGITGTNGKTSCSQFLGQLLDHCGIIGTLGWGCRGDLTLTGYTTPDALTTQAILAECVQRQFHTVAMEVSSHGLAEGRINGINFKGAVLTNISRDHLDFHGTMAAYIETKKSLFARPEIQFAVINLDDALSAEFIAVVPEHTALWGYCIGFKASEKPGLQLIVADNIAHQTDGLSFDIHWKEQTQAIHVPLYGAFNIENLLAVAAVMLALGHSLGEIAGKIGHLQPVTGRMQRFGNNDSALIFVDYAHTPDALQKALMSARQHCRHELWVVFGCGGDRDTGKRAEMGRCAEQYADHVIITDDNPRSEYPPQIVKDILSGCQSEQIAVIHDRAGAIRQAITQASKKDCIVIAGKGHEEYQEYKHQKIPFSDAAIVMQALEAKVTHS